MFLAKMNYLEVEEYLKKSDTIVIPVGSLENHGKHMPLGTDTMIPDKIAEILDIDEEGPNGKNEAGYKTLYFEIYVKDDKENIDPPKEKEKK